MYYKSLITGKLYPREDYLNHGKGGFYRGYKDLPSEEYPYTIVDNTWKKMLSDLSQEEIDSHINKFDKNCYSGPTLDEFLKNTKPMDGIELKYLIEVMDKAPTKPTLKNRL